MTLIETIIWWESQNHPKHFLDDAIINEQIDKDELLEFILRDLGDMEVPWQSEQYHDLVLNFFYVHKWNIDKLVETTLYEYNPLDNFGWSQTRQSERDIATGEGSESNKENTLSSNNNFDRNGSSSGNDVHLVSAFNDDESPKQVGVDANGNPIYQYEDVEQYRDYHTNTYKEHSKDELGTESNEHQTTEKNIKTDDDLDETIKRSGNLGISYQSLIEEERRQAEFNIYKWIQSHFAKELVVAIF